MKKKLYYRVYQNRENMYGNSFIEKPENIKTIIEEWQKNVYECDPDELPPVFEPIFMNEDKFNNLEEFEGF